MIFLNQSTLPNLTPDQLKNLLADLARHPTTLHSLKVGGDDLADVLDSQLELVRIGLLVLHLNDDGHLNLNAGMGAGGTLHPISLVAHAAGEALGEEVEDAVIDMAVRHAIHANPKKEPN